MLAKRLLLAFLFAGGAMAVVGCGPTYPKCEGDEHCEEKGEFCVNGLCAQCRDDSQCSGPGMACSAGKCQRRVGYCDDTVTCPGNQKCRDNQCGAECLGDTECTAANTFCSGGSCVERPECGENATNAACPEGQDCQGGRCQRRITSCTADAVLFDFNKSAIKPNQKSKLDTVAACMNGDESAELRIAGHADERGTEEYNLALGEDRASSAKKYLTSKGVKANRVNTISFGENQPASQGSNEKAWSQNRRAEFGR